MQGAFSFVVVFASGVRVPVSLLIWRGEAVRAHMHYFTAVDDSSVRELHGRDNVGHWTGAASILLISSKQTLGVRAGTPMRL